MRRHLATGILFGFALLAQNSPTPKGTEPKPKPADYPAQAPAGSLDIAADFMVHTYGAQGQNFFTEEYLIVEVALYSGASEPVVVAANQFRLRVNGKKQTLLPDSPGMVANSIKYEDWESRRTVIGVAGTEDGGVVVGRPQQTERFPGDPRPGQSRLPAPPRAPTSKPGGVEPAAPPLSPAEAAVEGHLPEGTLKLPVSGYLFFRFSGKVKSADLIYEGPRGTATLVLKRKS